MIKDNFYIDRVFLEKEYEDSVWNGGISEEALKYECEKLKNTEKTLPEIKANIISFILRNADVSVHPLGLFADKINHCGITESLKWERKAEVERTAMKGLLDENKPLTDARVFTSDVDFGHTCPDWKYILKNGISGILNDINSHLKNAEGCDPKFKFYSCSKVVYEAIKVYLSRLADEAESLSENGGKNTSLIASSLRKLTVSAPETLHEAMQLIFIWYFLQQMLDAVYIRSLGGLDTLLYPYYKHDIENGIITEKEARTMIKYFLIKMGAKRAIANIPFYLCGSDENGCDLTNPLTHIILDEYISLDIEDPKIHIRCHKNLDKTVIMKVLESIRAGKNSFVFMNDEVVESSLKKIGVTEKDARSYTIVGCYEPSADGEIPCTCAGRVNIPQVLMLTLTDGYDIFSQSRLLPSFGAEPKTFEEFLHRFYKNLGSVCLSCMDIISGYEHSYMDICPSPIFSASWSDCMEKGLDVYAGGARYNNSSVCAFGLATAVDSLAVIKRAVYDKKLLTLSELTDILKNDWRGSEKLRAEILNSYPKYGNGIKDVDNMASELVAHLSNMINNKPNGRNGVFRLGLFSIDWRFWFGETTPATPDGRLSGETISKNMSASLGFDKNGVTALINSVTSIDYSAVPNGTVLDVLLHHTSVSGDDGLISLYGLLMAYIKKGGGAIQFNILNPDTLRAAQLAPERYRTLQVRLCGWNVHFVDLSRKEQDEFIRQTEHMEAV